MSKLPELTRETEEKNLREILDVSKKRLASVKAEARALEEELHQMQEEFNESDKEQQALWHNTDSRFQEIKLEILRAGQTTQKPYFGRIDFSSPETDKLEGFYIGRNAISGAPGQQLVIDWRAPISSVYYESSLGRTKYSVKGEGKIEIDLHRKRTYSIENAELKEYFDSEVVANDELLTKYLSKNKGAVLGEIIATIQAEQNEVIRMKPQHNMIIQGAAGSGKTTVCMHRISYILYNYDLEFKPEDFYVIGSNQVLLNYITGVLPELNVYGVRQMTMEQLFVRLLYEQWEPKKYGIKPVIKGVTEKIKGTSKWFHGLEKFARNYMYRLIPVEDVVLEKYHVTLMTAQEIEELMEHFERLSRADMISLLHERVLGKLETEICGKYYSYSSEEKKAYRRYYARCFGNRQWNVSVFQLYQEFLDMQAQAGEVVEKPVDTFDIYDLAAMAYLYKKLIETEIIREAGHVVIDEAQDFGMMAYHCLKYCLSKCTYTIMGDVSQNIYMDYGLNDWQELRKLMLPDSFDYFGLLRKSYRNTVEISNFATKILQHGSFQVYPVQPIIRHGEEVRMESCTDESELNRQCLDILTEWKNKGYETMAVICVDYDSAKRVHDELGKSISLVSIDKDGGNFETGISVLPLEMTKGLEFDAVIIYDCSKENYPSEDGLVKRLYVAATRALHELVVLYQGKLTGLIADPVAKDQASKNITETVKPPRKVMPEDERTHAEIARDRAKWGETLLKERQYIGPQRIQVTQQQMKLQPSKEIDNRAENNVRKPSSAPRKNVISLSPSVKLPSYLEEKQEQGITGIMKEKRRQDAEDRKLRREQEFGSMPEQNEISVPGHAKADHSIKMCIKGKESITLVSGYGTILIEALSPNMVRVCFAKGAGVSFPKPKDKLPAGKCSFQCRESREGYEIQTGLLQVKVIKKSGEISFWKPDNAGKTKLLLTEKAAEPRLVAGENNYTFWEWSNKEKLMAKAPSGKLPVFIDRSVRYISFGEDSDEMPGVHSDMGYELWFPSGRKTMCCNIAMYGKYICQEGSVTEYYFVLQK